MTEQIIKTTWQDKWKMLAKVCGYLGSQMGFSELDQKFHLPCQVCVVKLGEQDYIKFEGQGNHPEVAVETAWEIMLDKLKDWEAVRMIAGEPYKSQMSLQELIDFGNR